MLNRRALIACLVVPCFLLSSGCTSAEVSNTISIIGTVLQAGEAVLPILTQRSVISADQGEKVAAYVNGVARLMNVCIAGIKSGDTVISQISSDADALNAQLLALGALPPTVQTYVTTMTAGLAAVLASLSGTAKTATITRGHSVKVMAYYPRVTFVGSPGLYLKLSEFQKRAKRLAANTNNIEHIRIVK